MAPEASTSPVLIIYMRFCCLRDAAWLLIFWSSLWISFTRLKPCLCRCHAALMSVPDSRRARGHLSLHTCLLIWQRERAERKRTEDRGHSPSFVFTSLRDRFLPDAALKPFSLSLGYSQHFSCFILSTIFFDELSCLFPLTLQQMNNSLWWSRLQNRMPGV